MSNFSENGATKTTNKKYSFDEIEEILIKVKKMELEFENLPEELQPFSKEIEDFVLKYKIIDPNDCCGSGCTNCIMNEYEDNFEIYGPALKDLVKKINENNII
jgi:hypothetical protein